MHWQTHGINTHTNASFKEAPILQTDGSPQLANKTLETEVPIMLFLASCYRQHWLESSNQSLFYAANIFNVLRSNHINTITTTIAEIIELQSIFNAYSENI